MCVWEQRKRTAAVHQQSTAFESTFNHRFFATLNTTALGVDHYFVCFCFFISDLQVVMSEILHSAFQALCDLRNKREFTGQGCNLEHVPQRYGSSGRAHLFSSSGVSACKIRNFLFLTTHAVCFIFRCSGVLDLQTPSLGVNFTNFSDYTPNISMLLW